MKKKRLAHHVIDDAANHVKGMFAPIGLDQPRVRSTWSREQQPVPITYEREHLGGDRCIDIEGERHRQSVPIRWSRSPEPLDFSGEEGLLGGVGRVLACCRKCIESLIAPPETAEHLGASGVEEMGTFEGD